MIRYMMVAVAALAFNSCKTKQEYPQLIRDCPEEKIINKMPGVGKKEQPDSYFIYKGERREISEFDPAWVKEHCHVKETVVY